MSVTTGIGWDSHRLAEGRALILGGVRIEHDRGLAGHSDADVLTHAVIDALLGAAGLGDIGEHFPDTDERWRGADSLDLLRHVVGLLDGREVVHVDTTVVMERPKLKPHKPR
ncbi:MAG TPA: 2-C-methyl-D-erythritol 2,4-cyclodiphosphate synthase, partial [Solirubrobacteraceae bacterium]